MKDTPHILDCTLRDGGYLNNWNFPRDLVRNYLSAVHKAGIKFTELGFRFLHKNINYGEYAYSRDDYLYNLDIPDGLNVAVMIKSEELFSSGAKIKKALDYLFSERKNSPVSLVRIAAPYHTAASCREITEILKDKGYKISLNLTKIFPVDEKEILAITKILKEWGSFDILYFADTYGNISGNEVKCILNILKSEFKIPLGFHAHNNNGLAYENSLIAVKNGSNLIDSTIAGMGKGAGNLKTEVISKKFSHKYNVNALESLLKANFYYGAENNTVNYTGSTLLS